MEKLNNHDELVKEFAVMLYNLDKRMDSFESQIYLYVDEDHNEGLLFTKVDEFWPEMEGQSCLYPFYTSPAFVGGLRDVFDGGIEGLCEVVGVDKEAFFDDGREHNFSEYYDKVVARGLEGKVQDWWDVRCGDGPEGYEVVAESYFDMFYSFS